MATSDFAAPFASVELPPPQLHRGRQVLLLFGGWTIYGLLISVPWGVIGGGEPTDVWLHEVLRALATAWLWAAYTPVVVRTTRRLGARPGVARAIAVHGAMALAIVLGTALVRWLLLYWLHGPEAPRFGVVIARWLDHNIFSYAFIVGVTRALDLHRRWLARARRELVLQAELAGAKLQFLRRQLQPHFLFNCLNATAELTREDPLRAQRMLRHLQRLLRSALARSETEEVPLRDELATLEPYVELERMRFGDSLRVVRRVEDPALLDARVPVFILQPLVENAVQHGLAFRTGGGTLEIAATRRGDRLLLEVRNDGPGTGDIRSRRGGIGLRNTRSRLAQLYGADQSFELRHEPGFGTVAVIDIPFRPASGPSEAFASPLDATHAIHASASTSAAFAAIPEPPDDDAALPAVTLTGEMPAASRPSAPPRWRTGAIVAGFWLAMGGLWIVQSALGQLLGRGEVYSFRSTTIDFWNAMVWMVLTPVVLLVARRVRLRRGTWVRATAVHLATALVVDVAHLALLLQLCATLDLLHRPLWHPANVNQFTLNLIIYAGLVTWSHTREFAAWHQARVLSQARLDTALAQARWQALALELRPEFLLAVLERIARLAPEDPSRAERLVERLADFLRGTLDTVGRPVQPLRAELALLEECLELWGEATARNVALTVNVPALTLDRPVSSGTFRALTNLLVSQEPPAGAQVTLDVGAASRAGRLALTFRSTVPLSPDASAPDFPSWAGAAFPDARTAELDLGPADADGMRASVPVLPAPA